ncbi:MAG TPA: glycosyltransferase family 2 protein [Candidatus Saccharimonadales bacterium]|nr:glycosyltransferase family 2 protein [Candidatus Saccharimonadales bacterium]
MPVRIEPPPPTAIPDPGPEGRYVPRPADPNAEPVFSVIVPSRDEEASLEGSVTELAAALEEIGEPFEILVVDDGSRDGTGRIARSLADADRRVRTARHEAGRGLGAALRTAVGMARGSYIVVSPVGSPLDAEQIRSFHEAMEPQARFSYLPGQRACDIAVGFRRVRAGYRPWMRFAAWGYRMTMRVLFRMWLRDFTWICMYRRRVLDSIPFEEDSFVALPEILVRAKRSGLVLRQVPCPMRARRDGKGPAGSPAMLRTAITGMLRIWWRIPAGRPGSAR